MKTFLFKFVIFGALRYLQWLLKSDFLPRPILSRLFFGLVDKDWSYMMIFRGEPVVQVNSWCYSFSPWAVGGAAGPLSFPQGLLHHHPSYIWRWTPCLCITIAYLLIVGSVEEETINDGLQASGYCLDVWWWWSWWFFKILARRCLTGF